MISLHRLLKISKYSFVTKLKYVIIHCVISQDNLKGKLKFPLVSIMKMSLANRQAFHSQYNIKERFLLSRKREIFWFIDCALKSPPGTIVLELGPVPE